MEKISVIVPVYNVEKYLRKCLDSIVNQTYKNLEIILIDDGSTDNSGNICDEYKNKDSRINVIHRNNSGVSATKNCGMKISTGDYITFIDSDDTVDSNYLEILYNSLISTNSDISIIGYKVVNEKGNLILDSTEQSGLPKNYTIEYKGKDIIKELLLQRTIKNFVCKLYKKDKLCKFKEGITYEDIVFSAQVMMKTKKVVYTNVSAYNYLKRGNSITATVSSKNLNDFADAIKERYNLIKKNYPKLLNYNLYAFFESTVALSTKYVISGSAYEDIRKKIDGFVSIIKDYTKNNVNRLEKLFNDYDKLCLNLINYNTDLYLSFLLERHNLKKQNKL